MAPRPPIGAAVKAAARAVPDRPVRVARTLAGGASLRRAVAGRSVMVAGPDTSAAEAIARRVARARAGVMRAVSDLQEPVPVERAVDALVIVPVVEGDEWQAMWAGYFGPVRLILSVLKIMLARGRGQIVVVRERGRLPAPRAAARGAMDGFMACAAPELTGQGVTLSMVNVRPGSTSPEAAARAVAIALTHRSKRVDAD